MSFRKPFSKFREKMKHGLSRIGDKLERRGLDAGEGFDRSVLSLRSEPGVMAEGEIGEGSKTGEEGNPVLHPGDPESVLQSAVGRGHDLGGNDHHGNGGETDQSEPHLDPRADAESGSCQEESDQAAPRLDVGGRTPTPPILRGGGSEGM